MRLTESLDRSPMDTVRNSIHTHTHTQVECRIYLHKHHYIPYACRINIVRVFTGFDRAHTGKVPQGLPLLTQTLRRPRHNDVYTRTHTHREMCLVTRRDEARMKEMKNDPVSREWGGGGSRTKSSIHCVPLGMLGRVLHQPKHKDPFTGGG